MAYEWSWMRFWLSNARNVFDGAQAPPVPPPLPPRMIGDEQKKAPGPPPKNGPSVNGPLTCGWFGLNASPGCRACCENWYAPPTHCSGPSSVEMKLISFEMKEFSSSGL